MLQGDWIVDNPTIHHMTRLESASNRQYQSTLKAHPPPLSMSNPHQQLEPCVITNFYLSSPLLPRRHPL